MTTAAVGTASPVSLHSGGAEVSVSYLRDWHTCRRQFFWRYIFEWAPPSGARGCEPRYTGAPLLIGSAFHAGVAAWRLSGWADGKYDDAAAMAAVRATFTVRAAEFADEDDHAKALAECEDLMLRYCAKWANEYLDVAVFVLPDGRPAIEELFAIPLGGGYTMNVRPDAVVLAHGFLAALECKTAAPSRARTTLATMEMSPQTLAETYILRNLGYPIVGVYVDLAVKGNTRTVEKFQRVLVSVDEQLVDEFPDFIADTLSTIVDATAAPYLPLAAQLATFPMTGMFAGACERCSFRTLCWAPGCEAATLGSFRPRTHSTPTEQPIEE